MFVNMEIRATKILLSTFLLAAFSVSFYCAKAQDERAEAMTELPELNPETRELKWKKMKHEAHTLFLYAEDKDVEKAAKKFFEDKYDADFSNEKGMNAAVGIVMSDVNSETATLAFDVESEKDGSRLCVIVDLGGRSLNHRDHPQASASLDRLLTAFGRRFYKEAYAEVVKEQEDVLDDAEKAMGKLVKEGENLADDQQDASENIEKKKKEIEELQQEIEELEKKIKEIEKSRQQNTEAQQAQQKVVDAQKQRVNKLRQVASGLN